MKRLIRASVAMWILGSIGTFGTPASAQDLKAGEVIGPDNWKKVEGMMASYYLDRIKGGERIVIGDPPVTSEPKEYVEATRKYSNQVKLDANDGLVGYVAGKPFPNIDIKDPKAGLKLIWNHYWGWMGDDFSNAIVGGKGSNFKRVVIFENKKEIHAETGFYNLRALGRISIPPIPAFPEAEKKGIEFYFMSQTMYPRDTAGTTFLLQRYTDPTKWDDMWIYIPSIRRVRRFPTSQRCATLAPTDYNSDDSGRGFNGKVTHFVHKLVGKQKILLVTDWEGKPYPRRKEGDFFPGEMVWRPTDMWVVEQFNKDPGYCYSKRVLWIEPVTAQIGRYYDYDRKGELWKDVVVSYDGLDLSKLSGMKPGFRLIPVHVSLKNVQTGRITMSLIPAGFTFNMGLQPQQFTISTIEQGIRGAGLVR